MGLSNEDKEEFKLKEFIQCYNHLKYIIFVRILDGNNLTGIRRDFTGNAASLRYL